MNTSFHPRKAQTDHLTRTLSYTRFWSSCKLHLPNRVKPYTWPWTNVKINLLCRGISFLIDMLLFQSHIYPQWPRRSPVICNPRDISALSNVPAVKEPEATSNFGCEAVLNNEERDDVKRIFKICKEQQGHYSHRPMAEQKDDSNSTWFENVIVAEIE